MHQHSARTQHFDLRLEICGVLVSWAVPKGPLMDPRDKRALERGHLVVELCGSKLRRGFALTRTDIDGRGRERWLLVKKPDAEAVAGDQPVIGRPESVLSGRTIEQLAAEAEWLSTRR
ncbi:MAG: DNA polymerase ligase N-terminal domain-containing protein [Gaiellaceae bacterium]